MSYRCEKCGRGYPAPRHCGACGEDNCMTDSQFAEVQRLRTELAVERERADRMERALRDVRIEEPDESWMHAHNAVIDAALAPNPAPSSEPEEMCSDCGEEPVSTDGRCRDCDIEHLHEKWPRCQCGAVLYNDIAHQLGLTENHAPDCPERKEAGDE